MRKGILRGCWVATPLGPMLALADEEALYLLEFKDRRNLNAQFDQLAQRTKKHVAFLPMKTHEVYRNNLKNREFGKEAPQNSRLERATIAYRQGASEGENFEGKPTLPKTDSSGCFGITPPIEQIRIELEEYFFGQRRTFQTPIVLAGTPFQQKVWEALRRIPYGQTRSYAEIAESVEKPSASRAVALANAANRLAIIIPCHRVIRSGGALGGYAGGVNKKEWLCAHERG